MAIKEFDVFVIGTGSSGKQVAMDCAEAGMEVAIADNREYGGTCANRGCDPKKVLTGVTEIVQAAKNLKNKGLTCVPDIDWSALMKYKNTFTSAVPTVHEKELKEAGISLYHQSPKFLDKNTLSVEGKIVKVKKVVIATGLIPLELKIQGREYLKTSDDFLSLEKLPEEIIFVGGGYIGIELAHLAARCGSKVIVIQSTDRILSEFDSDLTDKLIEISKSLGIKFLFNARVTKVEKLQKNYRVSYAHGNKTETVITQMVFNTAGRVPSIAELDLDKGKVSYEEKGISVNEFMQNTSNPNVYACGDVAVSKLPPLTPTANLEAKILSENIRNGNKTKLPSLAIPSVVHCIPQIASIGLNESDITDKKNTYQINYNEVPEWFSAKHKNEANYIYKVIIEKETNLIVGAHILATNAGEIINLFSMAINQKIKVNQIKNMVYAYPTWGNDIKSML